MIFTIKNINYKDFPLELDYENYEEDSKYMFQNMVISDFTKRIYDLVVAVNIAIVGSLDCDDGAILIDGKVVDKTKCVKPELSFASEYVKKFRWPTIKRLSILDTWNWLSKNEGYCNGVGGSSLDRSLSAFSYLFHTDNSNSIADLDMFWTMVGIEALYANNSFGVKDQIIEKTQIVLGELVDNKKAFKAIYDVRSRLVHGDMNFPGKFHIYDAQIEYENYYDKMDKATLLVKAILIATYQFMVENKIHNLNFKYNLDL